ncbi:MAG: PLP-dependent aspartate aminotransferase family protein [Neisseriaceae bacterium]
MSRKKLNTTVIHSSYVPEEHNQAVMPPIYQNSMFKLQEIGGRPAYDYSRLGNPTRDILEKTVAELEGGCSAFAFGSGVAAIDAIWRSVLKPGGTILAVADIYGGSYELLTQVYQPWGVEVIFVDMTQPDRLIPLIKQKAVQLIWLESPSNPLLKLIDIKQITSLAQTYQIPVGIDNTFATPYLQQPFTFGVDFIAHSATKYLCGHSDVVLGIAVVREPKYATKLKVLQKSTGGIAGPVDCSLVLRGIKTLAVRMKQHQINASIIAERLLTHPQISEVYYPGLSHHPQHDLAKKQMSGFGGIVSFRLKNDTQEAANKLVKKLKLFQLSFSLGGVESLINHSFTQSHSNMNALVKKQLGITEGLLRLSIGIEDVEDIWQDLEQALS